MKKYIIVYIILFSQIVVLHDFANATSMNIFMLGVMGASAMILPFRMKYIIKWDFLLLLVFIILLSSQYLHPRTFRMSTVMYSAMFMTQCVVFRTYIYSNSLSIDKYMKLIRALVFMFCAVLIIQQVMELAGMKGFNKWGHFESRWKLNSLAQEPSHLPPTMLLLLLSYSKIQQIIRGENFSLKSMFTEDKKFWIAGLYTMIGCGTTSGIFITPVFLAYFFQKQILKRLPILLLALLSLYFIFNYFFPYITERFNIIFETIWEIDPLLMYIADPSAAARISPYMFLIHEFSLTDINFLFGHGVDYAVHYFSLMLLGEELGKETGIGGLINFIYDYGIIAFLCFIIYIRKLCFHSFFSYEFIAWILVYTVCDFNVSLLWASILVFGINKWFEQNNKNIRYEYRK